jgi:hypothetical protein
MKQFTRSPFPSARFPLPHSPGVGEQAKDAEAKQEEGGGFGDTALGTIGLKAKVASVVGAPEKKARPPGVRVFSVFPPKGQSAGVMHPQRIGIIDLDRQRARPIEMRKSFKSIGKELGGRGQELIIFGYLYGNRIVSQMVAREKIDIDATKGRQSRLEGLPHLIHWNDVRPSTCPRRKVRLVD